jgi:uncharacterized protein YeaO (DUF488 family)
MGFEIKRVYEPARPSDGKRILVDRLWPRGESKARAALDDWMKDVAPTPELRTWFGHKKERFAQFKVRYRDELAANPAAAALRTLGKRSHVTLLYGATDPTVNHAVVLKAFLERPTAKKRLKT